MLEIENSAYKALKAYEESVESNPNLADEMLEIALKRLSNLRRQLYSVALRSQKLLVKWSEGKDYDPYFYAAVSLIRSIDLSQYYTVRVEIDSVDIAYQDDWIIGFYDRGSRYAIGSEYVFSHDETQVGKVIGFVLGGAGELWVSVLVEDFQDWQVSHLRVVEVDVIGENSHLIVRTDSVTMYFRGGYSDNNNDLEVGDCITSFISDHNDGFIFYRDGKDKVRVWGSLLKIISNI